MSDIHNQREIENLQAEIERLRAENEKLRTALEKKERLLDEWISAYETGCIEPLAMAYQATAKA